MANWGLENMPTNAGPTLTGASSRSTPTEDTRYRLEYLADLVLDLQTLARGCGSSTLVGLLALAHSEALIRSKQLAARDD